jgi:hypothetical protein
LEPLEGSPRVQRPGRWPLVRRPRFELGVVQRHGPIIAWAGRCQQGPDVLPVGPRYMFGGLESTVTFFEPLLEEPR